MLFVGRMIFFKKNWTAGEYCCLCTDMIDINQLSRVIAEINTLIKKTKKKHKISHCLLRGKMHALSLGIISNVVI